MNIEFAGRTWRIDPDEITNRQSDAVWKHTGLSVSKWLDSLKEEAEPARFVPAWEALYWLMLQQNGDTGTAVSDVDFPLYKFAVAFMEAYAAEVADAKEAEPDPTRLPADSAPSVERAARKTSARAAGVATSDG